MLSTLFTGVSGLDANETYLSVIGNNIANMNTIGFKTSSIDFGDILSATLAGGSSQVGRGVLVTGISPLFTQGSFESTANSLDLAIDGDGFFVVSDGTSNYYTRAGQFALDKNGNVVNDDGLILQGYQANAVGDITGTAGDLQISATQSPANESSKVDVAVNLPAGADTTTWAFTSPSATPPDTATYNDSTSVTVYDSQGGAHSVTVYLAKTADNAWTAHYVYQDASGQYREAGSQNLTFGADGSLAKDNPAALTFNWGGGAKSGSVTFNYGDGTGDTPAGTGLDMTTQFASDFSVMSLSQDGYAAGSLKSITISDKGVVTGVFTNGQTRNIGQVELAKFIAPTKLTRLGRNLFGESYDSGQPIIGTAVTSGLGRVLSNTLEQSNVDLAGEFVRMIAAQRGFQANSKIITTTDELMQDLVNLKR